MNDIATHGRAIEDEATTAKASQADAQRAATEAATLADAAAEKASRAERIAQRGSTRSLMEAMRQLSSEIDGARQAAVEGALSGDNPAGTWVTYRLTAARLLGQWQALADHSLAATGRRPPPGPSERLPPLPGPGVPPGRAEGYERFITTVLSQAEPMIASEAQHAAAATLRAET